MQLTNNTKVKLPLKWIQKILDHLRVNPYITVEYADNPEKKKPNYCQNGVDAYGVAITTNDVVIFFGGWEDGKFKKWTAKQFRWVIAHELKHQYYSYHRGNRGLVWRDKPLKEQIEREERACNRFADKMVGKPKRDFDITI
jgi:hypothetical protein